MEIWLERPFAYKRPWTPEEDELIHIGKQQGYTVKRIAESLEGRTYRAVGRRWQQIKKRVG